MLGTKNFSPNQISLFTAIFIAIFTSLPVFILVNWKIGILAFLVISLLCYFLIKQVFERFIYRKIKLIYKIINNTKAGKKEEMYYQYILPQKSMTEVSQDVMSWAEKRKAEIESLKVVDNFRRDFMQNLSHEIKTPIFAIQGYVDMLLEDDVLDDEEEARRLLKKVHKNIERMTHILSDIDEIEHLENGTQNLNISKFVIQELIFETFDSLSIQTVKKNIQTILKKGCEYPIAVYADKEKIRQVLINLVINAAKYGKENGHIVASVYKLDEERVLVEISDDGIGIAEDHVPRVFERFYRTDKARTRKVGGSGLGLAICKHILEAHGESIHLRSKLGVGSTFGFTLPTTNK
ncbi:sensor histidine kinase [Rhizosphaericola mali]|uniref:histidine kinase n=2 Tax=Rhizosphaericola mali TaxID=2545455 RepID=A0A5P2G2X0_9BACT|nr:sensor histidine kinase [Rhizosphaericola mali]